MGKMSEQISYLSDEDLSLLYLSARKILKKRGILDRVNKVISKELPLSTIVKEMRPHLAPAGEKNDFVRGDFVKTKNQSILFDFLNDDWSFLFNETYDEERKYYVYYHSNPNYRDTEFKNGDESITFKGRPFYVGKGTGLRFQSKHRSRSHIAILNKIESVYSKNEIYHIFKDGLSEREALELEAKLITFFGCESEVSKKKTHFHGYHGGLLINADPSRRPENISKLISIRGLSTKD